MQAYTQIGNTWANYLKFSVNGLYGTEELYLVGDGSDLRLQYKYPEGTANDGSTYPDFHKALIINKVGSPEAMGFTISESIHGSDPYIDDKKNKFLDTSKLINIGLSGNRFVVGSGTGYTASFHMDSDGTVRNNGQLVTLVRTNYGSYFGIGGTEVLRLIWAVSNIGHIELEIPDINKRSASYPLSATDLSMIQGFATNWYGSLQSCDSNKDGNIDKNEMVQVLARAGTPYQTALDTVNRVFQVLDRDGNGILSLSDISYYNQSKGTNPQQPQQPQPVINQSVSTRALTQQEQGIVNSFVSNFSGVLQTLDTNKDGSIDRAELTRLLMNSGTPNYVDCVNQIFSVLDKDSNGIINYADIQRYSQPTSNSYQPQVQQPQVQQPQGLAPYMNLAYEGYPIFRKGQMEEYYASTPQGFKQIVWLREGGGGRWVKNGW